MTTPHLATPTQADAPPAITSLSPQALRLALESREEIAVLDVRETGLFALKHLLFAVSAPAWRLELLLDRLVPRRSTRVVLTDLDGTLVLESAQRLQRLGYPHVEVLEGGTLAWEAAGYEVFTGVNVPSKALGEVVEVQSGTPHIDVLELRDRLARKEKLVVVDGRTPEEFHNFSLPGAHSVPNAELGYRIRELAPDPNTLVVVNCAGRTRSIVGAQTLIDAGIPNPVVSLKDGTMAWLLSGHKLESGHSTPLPEPTQTHLKAAREGAQALLRRTGVRHVDTAELGAWQADDSRSLYLFDIRSEDEYRAGHLPGWRWAPGGQLVQATDEYIGTRGARVVLADWDGIRSVSSAAWLTRLGGYEVYLYQPPADAALEAGAEPVRVLRDGTRAEAPWIAPASAWELAQAGSARVVDVDRSLRFRRRHIQGAEFIAPNRLTALLGASAQKVVVTSEDGVLARVVASGLRAHGIQADALLGGNQAWFKTGLPTAEGDDGNRSGEDDAYYGGYAYADLTVRDARFREYLDWELGLPAQLERAGSRTFFRQLNPG